MKKKLLITTFCTIAMLLVLGGCNKSDGRTPTLIWWTIGTPQFGFAEDLRIISDYTEEKIGVRLDIKQAGWGEAAQRFNTIINAGEYFDIMFVNGTSYNRYTSIGAFEDLTDLLPVYAPELLDYIPSVLWDGVRVKDRIYSIPTYKDSSVTGYYFWDSRFVEKYNIDLTRSGWAYLDEVFRRMKAGEKNPRFYPYLVTRNHTSFIFDNYDDLSTDFQIIGVRHDDPQRRVVNVIEQPDVIEAFRYMHSWYRDGIINPDANMIDEAPKAKPFFMAQAWPSVAPAYAVQEGVERYEPVRCFGPSYSTGSIQGSMNAVSVNSKYKREALLFLQLVNTDVKLRDMLHMGIEGKHFEYVNDGTAIRRLRTDWPLVNYQQGSYFIQTPPDSVPAGYWEEVLRQNEEAVPSVMLGFMMDTEPVQSELVNCRTVWEKYRYDLITGASNPSEVIPRLITELKRNGLDKIIEEAQKQVNEFSAKRR